jgi:hypothetical protein
MVRLAKKAPQKKGGESKVSSQKRLTGVQCWLTEGQQQDEEMQPILWTEWPNCCIGGCWFTLAQFTQAS